MSVYFGKMKDPAEYAAHVCNGIEEYFNGIVPGDYAFIRLAGGKSKIKTLWKFDHYDVAVGQGVFELVCDFSPLPIEKFLRLDLLNFDKNVILTSRQSRTRGFFKLNLTPGAQNVFDTLISGGNLGRYVADHAHFRNIVYEDDPADPTGDPTKDVLIGLVGGAYKILNDAQPFLAEFAREFDPSRYDCLGRYLAGLPGTRKCASHRKAKRWLDSKGQGEVTLMNLWDLFCSRGAAVGRELTFEDEDETEADEAMEKSAGTVVKTWDPKNLIIYGIPGCGKSYRLKNDYLKDFDENKVVRTTFHQEYSNCDFVGQVRPVKDSAGFDYKVIAGPFTKALYLALKEQTESSENPDSVALVIEEINRGNAAAIFGDLFQLLDRDDSTEESEYEITNEIIASYLNQKGVIAEDEVSGYKIKIPANLYLYATMNTSDQNVFKLDTAFKRRWEFERLTNKDTEKDVTDFPVFTANNKDVNWLEFIKAINAKIVENDEISGDRQIGNFFYRDAGINLKRFANKVLEYLYNDVCKYGGKEDIFKTEKYKSFDDIYNAFVAGDNVFRDELFGTDSASAPISQANGDGATTAPAAATQTNDADASVKTNDGQ